MKGVIVLLLFSMIGMIGFCGRQSTPIQPEVLTEQDSALTAFRCEAQTHLKIISIRDIGARRAYAQLGGPGGLADCFTQFGKIQGLTIQKR